MERLRRLPTNFIGLDNFTRLFADPIFLGDLWRGLILIVLSLVVQLPFALGHGHAAQPAHARPGASTG